MSVCLRLWLSLWNILPNKLLLELIRDNKVGTLNRCAKFHWQIFYQHCPRNDVFIWRKPMKTPYFLRNLSDFSRKYRIFLDFCETKTRRFVQCKLLWQRFENRQFFQFFQNIVSWNWICISYKASQQGIICKISILPLTIIFSPLCIKISPYWLSSTDPVIIY